MPELSLSVVIPTYNRGHLIRRAINSVVSQLPPGDEILVVDDVIAFQDSDNECLPGKAALQGRFLAARPDVLFCLTDFARDYGGRRNPLLRGGLWHGDLRGWDRILAPPVRYFDCDVYIGDLYHGSVHHNYFSIVCTMIRGKEAADAADWVARAKSRLTVLNRVWGSDPEFLASIGGEYHRLVRAVRQAKIRGLVALGRLRDARSEIRSFSEVPLPYRAAALRRALHNLRTGSAAAL